MLPRRPLVVWAGGDRLWLPTCLELMDGLNRELAVVSAVMIGGRIGFYAFVASCHEAPCCVSLGLLYWIDDIALSTVATPGQAGLPAEFKHINKRRRRNLQGFP